MEPDIEKTNIEMLAFSIKKLTTKSDLKMAAFSA